MLRKYPIVLTLSILFLISGCKKGADDPKISLRTRKARLEGEWRLVSGFAGITTDGYNDTYTFDGSNFKENFTSYTPIIYIGKYLFSLKISKDGTFKFKEFLAGETLDAEGTWNFNSGVGEEKKKEDVIFSITKVNKGYTDGYNLFNRFSANFVYNIVELRNKRLVIHSTGKIYSDSRGSYVTMSTSYVFQQ